MHRYKYEVDKMEKNIKNELNFIVYPLLWKFTIVDEERKLIFETFWVIWNIKENKLKIVKKKEKKEIMPVKQAKVIGNRKTNIPLGRNGR